MALSPGARLGAYEVLAFIGAGGMGEVYRARDTRLNREIALKVLPDSFASDAERLARFTREAQTLASLNHPHIAHIHGLEESDGVRALVMELVEGEDLSQRIARGAIPLDEALPIAWQIAEALEAAHEAGIIHRDLKPANIKVRSDGTVKVLDFGLAKATEPTPGSSPSVSMSPTITTPAMTHAGMILGTAAYMAPEQARGKTVDRKADVWAFGCVLYEMLTGKRAFEGEDVSDTLASVLRSEPDWVALPADVPPPIVSLIKRSLEKDRRRRIGDVAVALFVLTESHAPSAVRATAGNVLGRYAIALVAAAVIVAAAVGGWWLSARSVPTEPKQVTRFVVPLRGDEQFTGFGGNLIALSPDGKRLAYFANNRLNLHEFDSLESVPVRGTESALTNMPALTQSPFFSPDGQWIGFLHDGQIKRISIQGGAHVPISPAPNATAFAWEDDGTILFAARGSIWRVPEAGGTPEVLVDGLDGGVQSLQLLPGKRAILFTRFPPGTISGSEIVVQSLDTRERHIVSSGGIGARYLPTGHLVYYDAGTLLAVPFDPRALAVTGAPVPVAEAVASSSVPGRAVSAAHVAISRTGTLAYVPLDSVDTGARTLVWVDRAGREELLGVPDRPYVYPRLSTDESRIALTIGGQQRDIWIWDFGLKNLRLFTGGPAQHRYAIWTPDGKHILFGSNRGDEAGTWRQAADGSGVPERVAVFPIKRFGNFVPTTISPDGSSVVVTATGAGAGGGADLWLLKFTGDVQAAPLLATTDTERNAEISPDGRWMAYESVVGGQTSIWVRPFPDVNGGRWQVSPDGGSQPLWARSGKELFFRDLSGALMSVSIEGQLPHAIGPPAKILEGAHVHSIPTYAGRLYDVSKDGQRFLMLKQSGPREQTGAPRGVTVVQNWTEELKRLVPTR
jgi:Tol biopolymer transport system component